MQQVASILALSVGATMLLFGGIWYMRIALHDDPDPWRLAGSWVCMLIDIEKWRITWKPIALQLIGGALLAWGWAAVQL